MKHIVNLLAFLLLLLVSSCKKKDNSPPSTVLLSKIVDNTPGDPANGQPILSISYNGKQISQVLRYNYNNGSTTPGTETHIFIYKSNLFAGTTILNNNYPFGIDTTATVATYVGNNLSAIQDANYQTNFVYPNGAIDINGNYINGSFDDNYTQDEKHNYSSENYSINGSKSNVSTLQFDNQKNIVETLPLWQYFYAEQSLLTSEQGFGGIIFNVLPNANNTVYWGPSPVTTFSYVYGSNGYPSSVVVNFNGGQDHETYSFQYITVQ